MICRGVGDMILFDAHNLIFYWSASTDLWNIVRVTRNITITTSLL